MPAKDLDFTRYVEQARFDGPVIFLYGSNADFVDSAVSSVISVIKAARSDLSGVERITADAVAADPPLLLDFFAERALFGEQRFLAVSAISERQASLLTPFFSGAAPQPGPLLLLSAHALTSRSKLLAAARAAFFCQMLRAYEAPFSRSDVGDALRQLGVDTVEPRAMDAVHQRLLPEDPSRRTQLLQQLALYATDGRLGESDVAACINPDDAQLVGELSATLLSGEVASLVRWRRRAAMEGADPVQQIALIARALGEVRRARQGGAGVFWKTERAVTEAARRLTRFDSRVEHAIVDAQQLERAARSSEGLLAEKTERLMLRLARLFA